MPSLPSNPGILVVGRWRWAAGLLCSMIAAALLAACASAPKSSRLAVDDIEYTAEELAAKLSSSDFLLDRTADSPRISIAITKVENLSTDIIPETDRWYMMVKVRGSQQLDTLRRLRNIVFVVPAEHLRDSQTATEFDREYASGRKPTHEMSATFRSATRAAGQDRTDAYLCELRVTDLTTRELAWTDIVEFKKTAFGKAYD
ncbi:hypothetical protein PHYC_02602 [Phycisphaerales bacterium]|nr:hypothetical protein PHYC_02602 [Phycisphaerales bacterium]